MYEVMLQVGATGMKEKAEEECKYLPFVIGYTSAVGTFRVFVFSSCAVLELI
jgi:hypothetical protein